MPSYNKGQQIGLRLGDRQKAILDRIAELHPHRKPPEVLRESLECLAARYEILEGLPL